MMGWLDAMLASALIILLAVVIAGTFVLLMIWAMNRGKDVEMFIAIVITVVFFLFTLIFRIVE